MADERGGERHSKAFTPELIADPEERARREAENGLRQFDLVIDMFEEWRARNQPFKLRPSRILALHRAALDGISGFAGNFRPAGVMIEGSKHQPPGGHLVAELVEELCDYVNEHWDSTAVHLSAYVMWRINWIHPFDDGNGRTARAASYLALLVRLGWLPPGENTIPEQISRNKDPYYEALEAADAAYGEGRVDVSKLEDMLADMLASQLAGIFEQATGKHG
jgi:Fic family protein